MQQNDGISQATKDYVDNAGKLDRQDTVGCIGCLVFLIGALVTLIYFGLCKG